MLQIHSGCHKNPCIAFIICSDTILSKILCLDIISPLSSRGHISLNSIYTWRTHKEYVDLLIVGHNHFFFFFILNDLSYNDSGHGRNTSPQICLFNLFIDYKLSYRSTFSDKCWGWMLRDAHASPPPPPPPCHRNRISRKKVSGIGMTSAQSDLTHFNMCFLTEIVGWHVVWDIISETQETH